MKSLAWALESVSVHGIRLQNSFSTAHTFTGLNDHLLFTDSIMKFISIVPMITVIGEAEIDSEDWIHG